MKLMYLLIAICCTGCLLQEYRTTVYGKHIFSQEDSAFYFSDCNIASRADSFELVRLTKALKFWNATDLSKGPVNEIRFLYSRSFDQPYLISLLGNGTMKISTIDTAHYDQYEYLQDDDSLRFSPLERKVQRVTYTVRYYNRHGYYDSAAMIKAEYGNLVDSLYDLHLRLMAGRLIKDTVTVITTTLYVSPTVFYDITAQLDSIDFWEMPVYKDIGANDGAGWTLEAKSGGRHHISSQVNMHNQSFEKVCRMLLRYANMPEKRIY